MGGPQAAGLSKVPGCSRLAEPGLLSAPRRRQSSAPLTRVDDLAARVQVVQRDQQLAGEVAHHRQRDATVVVQPAHGAWGQGLLSSLCADHERTGRRGSGWRRGRQAARHSKRRVAGKACGQPPQGLLLTQRAILKRPSPDEREQVVPQDLEHHAHVLAVRAGMLKPVDHAAAVVLVLCRQGASAAPRLESTAQRWDWDCSCTPSEAEAAVLR